LIFGKHDITLMFGKPDIQFNVGFSKILLLKNVIDCISFVKINFEPNPCEIFIMSYISRKPTPIVGKFQHISPMMNFGNLFVNFLKDTN
jgi:hypothetical protein